MIYSKQKIFCNCCGREMFTELPNVFGIKFRVCSKSCIREMQWRDTLSVMGKEYYPDPNPFKEDL